MEWKDATSYSRGDKERVPTSYSLSGKYARLTVTKGHVYYKGEWVMVFSPIVSSPIRLNLDADQFDEKTAQKKALLLAHAIVQKIEEDLTP